MDDRSGSRPIWRPYPSRQKRGRAQLRSRPDASVPSRWHVHGGDRRTAREREGGRADRDHRSERPIRRLRHPGRPVGAPGGRGGPRLAHHPLGPLRAPNLRTARAATAADCLADIDEFDPMFFRISGAEAVVHGPTAAPVPRGGVEGARGRRLRGYEREGDSCGVYVGCTAGDYRGPHRRDRPPQAFWGNSGSITPARIAYHLDLQGPAIAVETACSSSLVAIHLACQALWQRETEMAIAGGVTVTSTPAFYRSAGSAGMLSPPAGATRSTSVPTASFRRRVQGWSCSSALPMRSPMGTTCTRS